YLFSNAKTSKGDVIITVPLTREYLAALVPGLGLMGIDESPQQASRAARARSSRAAAPVLPPPVNRFDSELVWFATVPAMDWETPGKTSDLVLAVLTRVSAVISTVFSRKDLAQEFLEFILIFGF